MTSWATMLPPLRYLGKVLLEACWQEPSVRILKLSSPTGGKVHSCSGSVETGARCNSGLMHIGPHRAYRDSISACLSKRHFCAPAVLRSQRRAGGSWKLESWSPLVPFRSVFFPHHIPTTCGSRVSVLHAFIALSQGENLATSVVPLSFAYRWWEASPPQHATRCLF